MWEMVWKIIKEFKPKLVTPVDMSLAHACDKSSYTGGHPYDLISISSQERCLF